MSKYILEGVREREKRDELLNKALEDFRSGKPLGQITRDLQALDLATESDVAYVESLPQEIHDEIHSTIRGYIDRDESITVLFDHEPADEFEVRVTEHEDGRTVTLILLGPHH